MLTIPKMKVMKGGRRIYLVTGFHVGNKFQHYYQIKHHFKFGIDMLKYHAWRKKNDDLHINPQLILDHHTSPKKSGLCRFFQQKTEYEMCGEKHTFFFESTN
mmetsp:Transcript_21492/g.31147  ORF Transcript_21492/g.31147 Transcript_21492/m.31147 type:complete len:102 (-) Transcript_21492:544-849(-)